MAKRQEPRTELIPEDQCGLCERDCRRLSYDPRLKRPEYDCDLCGRYTFWDILPQMVGEGWTEELRKGLSCATRQASDAGKPLEIVDPNAVNDLAAAHLKTRVNENFDRLLFKIAERSERVGGLASFDVDDDFTIIDCFEPRELRTYLEWISREGFIERLPTNIGNRTFRISLTMKGWDRVQPLPRTGGIPGRCFVAMWFSQELQTVYETGIKPAVEKAGFTSVRIDQKEHNNEITDEIIAEIRNSQFVVADFTGQRAGVYYEAGFAMGLGRPVIWCCRKNEIRKLHFDTNHKNHIDWQTPEELQERLYLRIRTTILEQG